MAWQVKDKIYLPGWNHDVESRKDILRRECGEYPFPVAVSESLRGLKGAVADLSRDLEARFLIHHRSKRHYLSRSPGRYHLGREYSQILGIINRTPQGSEWLYEVSRGANKIVNVVAHNGAGIEDIKFLLGDSYSLIFRSVEPVVNG